MAKKPATGGTKRPGNAGTFVPFNYKQGNHGVSSLAMKKEGRGLAKRDNQFPGKKK